MYLKLQYVQSSKCQVQAKTSHNYIGISQINHSKAEIMLNLYNHSIKYKISKICAAALSENRQRDSYSLASLVQALHISNISRIDFSVKT